jgi:hypothetical protein
MFISKLRLINPAQDETPDIGTECRDSPAKQRLKGDAGAQFWRYKAGTRANEHDVSYMKHDRDDRDREEQGRQPYMRPGMGSEQIAQCIAGTRRIGHFDLPWLDR